MGKTLEDAGMLVKGDNGELKVSEPTTRKFLKIRNNLIEKGDAGLPFPCVTIDEKSRLSTLKIFWEDKEKYPAFFKKWIEGILFNELKNLNVDGNIALPVYDPLALGAKLNISNLPNLPLPTLFGALALPPGTPLPLFLINLKLKEAVSVTTKIPELITPPVPPIPKLPVPIDVQFPNLSFTPPGDFSLLANGTTIDPSILSKILEFSLLGKHIALNTSLPKMIQGMLSKVFSIDFLASLTPFGVFELACKVLNENSPPPPATNNQTDMGSYNISFAAIAAIKAEALAISMLGSVIGSSESGITGQLGSQQEHRDPPPPPAPLGNSTLLEAGSVDYFPPHDDSHFSPPTPDGLAPPIDGGESTGTSGVWVPAIPAALPSNPSTGKVLSSKDSYIKSWNAVTKALNQANNSGKKSEKTDSVQYSGNPRPFTVMHSQIVQGIIGNESGNGSVPAAGTKNNWAGIECPVKNGVRVPPGNATGCPGIYAEYPDPSYSIQSVFGLLTVMGASHKIKTQGISIPCYLLKNGPADKDEPSKVDINDNRATFYRVYYALRRKPMYYETYSGTKDPKVAYAYVNADAYKRYNGKVSGWHTTPELTPGGAELFAECVKKYAEGALIHIQAALYHNGVPWAMPKGTYEDAHLWWINKFRQIKSEKDWNDEFVLNK